MLKSISQDTDKSEILDDAMRPSRRAVLHQVGNIFTSGLNLTTSSVKRSFKVVHKKLDNVLQDKKHKQKSVSSVSILEIDHKGDVDKYKDIPADSVISIGCNDEFFIKLSYLYSLHENKYSQTMPVDLFPVAYAVRKSKSNVSRNDRKVGFEVFNDLCTVEVNSRIGRLDSDTMKSVYDSILTFGVDISRVPSSVQEFDIGLLIVFGSTRLQSFSKVENLHIEVLNETSRKSYVGIDVTDFMDSKNVEKVKELCKATSNYDISDKIKDRTSLGILRFKRSKSGWGMQYRFVPVPFDVEKEFTEFHSNLVLGGVKDYLC